MLRKHGSASESESCEQRAFMIGPHAEHLIEVDLGSLGPVRFQQEIALGEVDDKGIRAARGRMFVVRQSRIEY